MALCAHGVCSRMYVRTYAAHALHSRASNVNVNRGSRIMRSPAPRGLQMSPGKSLTTHKDALSVVSLSFERAVIKSGTSGRLSYVPDPIREEHLCSQINQPVCYCGYLSRDRHPAIFVNFNCKLKIHFAVKFVYLTRPLFANKLLTRVFI